MKKFKNLFTAILGVSFLIWLFSSLVTPFTDLYQNQTASNYFLGFNTLLVVGFIVTKVLPQAIKRVPNSLNLKTGLSKEKKPGCSSCKRKKRFD